MKPPGSGTHNHCSHEELPCVALQGSWSMEGEMLKGVFVRKDNGKQLITTRVVEGDELIQVNTTVRNMQDSGCKCAYLQT